MYFALVSAISADKSPPIYLEPLIKIQNFVLLSLPRPHIISVYLQCFQNLFWLETFLLDKLTLSLEALMMLWFPLHATSSDYTASTLQDLRVCPFSGVLLGGALVLTSWIQQFRVTGFGSRREEKETEEGEQETKRQRRKKTKNTHGPLCPPLARIPVCVNSSRSSSVFLEVINSRK